RQPLQLGGHVGIVGGEFQRLVPVGAGAAPFLQQSHDLGELGMPAAEIRQLGSVGDHVRVGEICLDGAKRLLDLGEALGQAGVHQTARAPCRAATAESGTAPRLRTSASLSSSRAVTMEAMATSIWSSAGRLVVNF